MEASVGEREEIEVGERKKRGADLEVWLVKGVGDFGRLVVSEGCGIGMELLRTKDLKKRSVGGRPGVSEYVGGLEVEAAQRSRGEQVEKVEVGACSEYGGSAKRSRQRKRTPTTHTVCQIPGPQA